MLASDSGFANMVDATQVAWFTACSNGRPKFVGPALQREARYQHKKKAALTGQAQGEEACAFWAWDLQVRTLTGD